MPEGDVLFRTASTLQRWLAGREVTDATATAKPMVGHTVEKVEAMAKKAGLRTDRMWTDEKKWFGLFLLKLDL